MNSKGINKAAIAFAIAIPHMMFYYVNSYV
jgi:hypothetical protein